MKISKRTYAISAIIAVVAPLFVSTPAQAAPLGKVSGTVLLLLAQKPGNATFDSSDYGWVPITGFTLPTYLAP